VVGDGWLAEADWLSQVTHARLLASVSGDEGDEPQPRRVSQRLNRLASRSAPAGSITWPITGEQQSISGSSVRATVGTDSFWHTLTNVDGTLDSPHRQTSMRRSS
jgi:hypothetical protein